MERVMERVERWRIRGHLRGVVRRLEHRSHPTADAARNQRRRTLRQLADYADAGVFPRNTMHRSPTSVFVDDAGRPCAVAALIGGGALVDAVRRGDNLARIRDITDPRLDQWAADHGVTRDELGLIQPQYITAWDVAELAVIPLILTWMSLVGLWLSHLYRRMRPIGARRSPRWLAVASVVSGIGGGWMLWASILMMNHRTQSLRSLELYRGVVDATVIVSPQFDVLLWTIVVAGLAMTGLGLFGLSVHLTTRTPSVPSGLPRHLAAAASWCVVALAIATWVWAITRVSVLTRGYACGGDDRGWSGWLPLPHVRCFTDSGSWKNYIDTLWIGLVIGVPTWLLSAARRRDRRPVPTESAGA